MLNPSTNLHESGQHYGLRHAMNGITETVERIVDTRDYEGELEDNGRRRT